MNMPGFTAEQALQAASQVYREQNSATHTRSDSIIPQYYCNIAYCTCCGYEDCYQMRRWAYCYSGTLRCVWDSRCGGTYGIRCYCRPAVS